MAGELRPFADLGSDLAAAGKSPSRNPGARPRRRILKAGRRRRGLGGRCTLRPPCRGLPGERGPRPPLRARAPRSPRPCSSPCAAGNQAGTTRRRQLYLRVSALPGPAAVAQVPSRRPAGNGRLRGGAAPHVRASRPEGPGDRPLKGTGPRSRRPRDAPRWSAETSPSAWKSLRNPFIH